MAAVSKTIQFVGAVTAIAALVLAIAVTASDPDPLQDFCVADLSKGATINGYPCRPADNVTAEDFAFAELGKQADLTGNPLNGTATFGFVGDWPALNTLGLSLARLDLAPGGVIVPHTHNLATEILFCLQGEIYTGFVTNSNKLYAKVVKAGEAFIFPRGLLHFQLNVGKTHAASLNVLNGQNPGIQLMPLSLFGSGIKTELLAKSFFITGKEVEQLHSIFAQFVDSS